MASDEKKPDIWELVQHWGWDDVDRVIKTFGIGAPDSKDMGELLKPFIVKRGEKSNPTKWDKSGFSKAMNAYPRVVQIRLMYLYLTVDLGMPQHVARADLAQTFKLSKKRISNLTVPKK